MGSIKFLTESDLNKASSIRLNEILLLILRMLAIAILVLILAGPVIKSEDSRASLTYIVDPSLLEHKEMFRILDTLGPGVEVRILAPDFPEYTVNDEVAINEVPDYWQLSRKIHELNSDSIVVFTAGYAKGFKGRRPHTGNHINWIQVIPDENVNEPIQAILKGDDVEIISVLGDHTRLVIDKKTTSFDDGNLSKTSTNDSIGVVYNGAEKYIPLRIGDTLKVELYHDEDLIEEMRYIRSSFNAISIFTNNPIAFSDISEEDSPWDKTDFVVWLSTSSNKETDSPMLMWKPDSLSTSLIEPGIKPNFHYLTGRLNSENIIEENLPEQLLQILNINREIEEQMAIYDRRVMPLEEILPLSGSLGGNIEIRSVRDISKYFWILLVVFLIIERVLSAYRKQ